MGSTPLSEAQNGQINHKDLCASQGGPGSYEGLLTLGTLSFQLQSQMVQALVICEFKASQGDKVRPCLTTSLVSKAANLSVPTNSGQRSHPPRFYRCRNKVWEVSCQRRDSSLQEADFGDWCEKHNGFFFRFPWNAGVHTVKKKKKKFKKLGQAFRRI